MMKVATHDGNIYCDAIIFYVHLVLRVQFASTIYSGLESSGEILVSILIVGGIPGATISVNIGFLERNATG